MKTLKRVLSVVLALTMLLSMMTIPAFAATTIVASGNEKLVLSYYKDAAATQVADGVEAGDTVYVKASLVLPTKSFNAIAVTLNITNGTFVSGTDKSLAVLGDRFEREILGTQMNQIYDSGASAQITVTKTDSASWDSADPNGRYVNLTSDALDLAVYEVKVADTFGAEDKLAISMSNTRLNIGVAVFEYDEEDEKDTWVSKATTFTLEGNEIGAPAAADVITTAYDATIANTPVDPELDQSAKEAAIKDLIAVTKVTTTNGSADAGVDAKDACSFSFDHAAKTVTVTFPADEKNTGATSETLTYTEMVITYGTPSVELDSSFEYALAEDAIADEVVVTVVKTKDGVEAGTFDLVAGTDYDVDVTFATDANEGSAVVTFIGDWDANTAVTKEFTRINAPVSYKDVVASISGSSFAYNVTEENIKAAITVKGTKVEGVVETANATVPVEAYEITVDLDAKTATVAMLDGTAVENADLTFEISEETFTYSNYAVEYTGEAAYDYTTTENIAGKVKVTATKTSNENPTNTETVDLTNEVEITVDKDADTITVTWKAESAHAGAYTFQDIPVTFNDVITYQNANATMNKTSFAEGTSEADILAEVVVTLEKLVNGTKDDTFVPAIDEDYIVTYADDEVTVDFVADGIANVVIPVTFYSASAVTAKVVLDTTTVADGKVTLGNDYVAYIELDGLTSAYGGEFTLSVNKGTIKTVEAATGYTINNVPAVDVASTTVEYTKAIGDDGITAGARVLKVTVSTVGTAKDDVVTLKVDSMKVSQVEDFDINELPTQTSEAKADVTIDQFVRAMSVELPKLEIGIVTLGTLNDDKYVDGVSIDGIDLTDKVSVDAAGRKLVIEDVVLDGSATEDEVTYTLKVVVPGYTTIEADIVIEYVSDENAVDYNTWKIKSNEITTDSKIYAGDVAGDDNTIAADDYSDIVAVYGDAVTTLYDLYEGGDVVDQKDIITMVWAFEQYGMTQVTAAGIIE